MHRNNAVTFTNKGGQELVVFAAGNRRQAILCARRRLLLDHDEDPNSWTVSKVEPHRSVFDPRPHPSRRPKGSSTALLSDDVLWNLAKAQVKQTQVKGDYLYLIEGAGRVKIGRSQNPQRRLSTLQTGCPCDLRIWALASDSGHLEAWLHLRFAEHRLHGEWFNEDFAQYAMLSIPFGNDEAFEQWLGRVVRGGLEPARDAFLKVRPT